MAVNGGAAHRWKRAARNGTLTINNNYIYRDEISQPPSNAKYWICYIICAAVSVLCYANSLHGDFVHDDVMAIRTNKDVQPRSPMSHIFMNDFWGKSMSANTSHKSYRPLCVLSFRANVLIGGMEPFGFHLMNVLLHTVATMLFMYMCKNVVQLSPSSAFLSALLFAVHPIHTEAVSGIVGRADVLCCVIYLVSFLAYHSCLDTRWPSHFPSVGSVPLFVLSLIGGAVSMLVKEQGITVLAVCMLYDTFIVCQKGLLRVVFSGRLDRTCLPLLTRLVVTVTVLVASLVFRLWMLNGQLPVFSSQDNPASFSSSMLTRVLTYCYLFSFNAWLLLNPSQLSYDWQMSSIPLVESLGDSRNLATLLFLVTICLLSIRFLCSYCREDKKCNAIFFGLVFLIIPFLPASNLFMRVGFVVAERILYIPSMGYCILIVTGLESFTYKFRRKDNLLIGLVVALSAILACRTLVRNQVWQSRESLFRSGIEILPHNAKAHYNYANYLKDSSRSAEAIHHYQEAIRLFPYHASANNNLGTMLNDTKDAQRYFENAIAINPYHTGAHFNLGNLLYKNGQKAEAIGVWQRAISIDPLYTDPYASIGSTMMELGDTNGAEKFLKKLIEEFPEEPDNFNNYGTFLQKTNHTEEALIMYKKAYELNQEHTISMVNAARLLRSHNKNYEAEQLYLRALCIKREGLTLDLLALLYFNTNRTTKALQLYEEVSHILPIHADAMTHYAQILARVQQHKLSEEVVLRVLSEYPNHTEALRQVANLYGILKRHSEALIFISRAIEVKTKSDVKDRKLIGLMFYEQGNHLKDLKQYDPAFQSYKHAIEYDASIPQAQLNIGAIYHMKNDLDNAEYHYSEALKYDPNSQVLKENMRKLYRKRESSKARK